MHGQFLPLFSDQFVLEILPCFHMFRFRTASVGSSGSSWAPKLSKAKEKEKQLKTTAVKHENREQTAEECSKLASAEIHQKNSCAEEAMVEDGKCD